MIWDGSNLSVNGITTSFQRDDFHWFTVFESLDGYLKIFNGSITINPNYIALTTIATAGDITQLTKYQSGANSQLTWDKNRKFKTLIRNSTAVNQFGCRIGVGSMATTSGNSDVSRHLGFWVTSPGLYATVADGTTEKYTYLTAIGTNQDILLEVKFTAATKAEFYVDGSLLYTETSNLPTGTNNAGYFLDACLTTNYNDVKNIWIYYWDFWQSN
jgi:hypothetical protein